MNVLLVLNYQREIPPFMISEIKGATVFFDKIDYITPELYNDNSYEVSGDQVSVIQLGKSYKVKAALKLPALLMRPEVRKDISRARKEKRFGIKFLKFLMGELIPSEIDFMEAKRRIINLYAKDNICVLSTWFDGNAYAAARLKMLFPCVKAVSFAHSFEVDKVKNDYFDISLNEFKHKYLDRVTFISYKVMENYLTGVPFISGEDLKKLNVRYLGSPKPITNEALKADKFHICSCSGVTPVKRLGLILEALRGWEDGQILWTHIGSGPLFDDISNEARNITQSNPLVEVELLGQYTNQEVHEYLGSHYIDLFINVSKSEGLPVSIMEAISYGIPVIATDVGGTSEIVNEDNGFLLDGNCDGEEIRRQIERFKNMPPHKINELRNNSKEKWNRNFDMSTTIPDFYKEILAIPEKK